MNRCKMRRWIGLAFAAATLSACASRPELTSSTPSRVYSASEQKVFAASVSAFENLGLEVFQAREADGYVEGGRTPGFARGSETVGVWIESLGPEQTRVSVDTKKALAGRMFAVDWTDQILGEIETELSR